jgi:hypothetical protein
MIATTDSPAHCGHSTEAHKPLRHSLSCEVPDDDGIVVVPREKRKEAEGVRGPAAPEGSEAGARDDAQGGCAAMTHRESQELKTYLEQQFGEVRERFANVDKRLDGIDGRFDGIDGRLDGIDGRLDGVDGRLARIDTHLDRQDIDFNKTTMNLLLTVEDARKDARGYAARLFSVLDRPSPTAKDAPEPARPRRPRRPRARSGR